MIVDFFPFFSSWSVHTQVDIGLAISLKQIDSSIKCRSYTCTHKGLFHCSISRDFIPDTPLSHYICSNCISSADQLNSYFDTPLHLPDSQLTDLLLSHRDVSVHSIANLCKIFAEKYLKGDLFLYEKLYIC